MTQALDVAAGDITMPNAVRAIPWGELKPYLARLVWQMYDNNQEQAVFTFRKWFVSFTVTVGMIRPLLEQWFGPHP